MRYYFYEAQGFKNDEQFVNHYKAYVNDAMRKLFPRMFLGKDASVSRGRFSVILARTDADSRGEEEFLRHVRLKKIGEAEFSDVERWAVEPERVLDLGRLANFLQPAPIETDDPFAASEGVIPDSVATTLQERFFLWLCATGQGSYETFRRIITALGLPTENKGASALLRRLRLLGHVEVSDDGQRWFVTPPTVVELDDGSGHFLAGARDVKSTEAVEAAVIERKGGVSLDRHEAREAPRAVRMTGVSASDIVNALSQRSEQAAAVGRAARQLAEALPPIDQAQTLFSRVLQPNTHAYDLSIHDAKAGEYKSISSPSRSGLYRLRSGRSTGGGDRTLLFLRDENAWYSGDWYGLAFVARHAAGERCTIGYDPRLKQVAIAKDWHLPEIYERALVLASGLLPRKDDGLFIYSGVTRETLDVLAGKLNAIVQARTHA